MTRFPPPCICMKMKTMKPRRNNQRQEADQELPEACWLLVDVPTVPVLSRVAVSSGSKPSITGDVVEGAFLGLAAFSQSALGPSRPGENDPLPRSPRSSIVGRTPRSGPPSDLATWSNHHEKRMATRIIDIP